MKGVKLGVFGAILVSGIVLWAQEFPRGEVGLDYSYVRFAPSAPYSKGHSINGGGGSIAYNINDVIGVKMDLQGYESTKTSINIPPNQLFPNGLSGRVQGNLFTYLFGPQITLRSHFIHPFGHVLFGGAHSNVYANVFRQLCATQNGSCPNVDKAPSNNTFAMTFGGGVDIPVGKHVAIRPAEVDYLLTTFDNPFTGGSNQHNFRYAAGVIFSFAHTSH